jgi:hypothetical protein
VFEDDGSKPRGERRRFTQRRQLSIRLDESFLRGVFGEVIIPQDRRGISHGDVLIRAYQFSEGEVVASLGRAH